MLEVERRPRRPRIGLVLGAGGIRGCAHAGVMQVLHEAGIPIDLVVGASTGSIFGLGLAADVPVAEIARVARAATPMEMTRFYAGRLRPGRGNPIARLLWDAAQGKTFADLPHPFAVRATDVETGVPTILDHGPLVPAIQASIALPFIAQPVEIDGRWYVDGGFFDTAPVGTAREMGAERVIAVCLGYNYLAPRFFRRRPWTKPLLERWGRQRRPLRGHLGDQFRFTCRLMAASFNPPLPCRDADVAIWPEFGKIGPNSMFGAAFCFDQGVRAARAALPEIERLLHDRPAAESA